MIYLLKASGPDCISVVAELFSKCLKESCFPDCWNVSSVVPVYKNVSVVSKVFEKLVNNRIVDLLEKSDLFSDFQYGFWSS